MKRLPLSLTILMLVSLACGIAAPTPSLDIHAVESIAAGTLTSLAPTQAPPTLIAVNTIAVLPSASAVPTQTPFPPLPPSSSPTRIQFAQGAVSATVHGTVAFPNRPQYVLYAFKGQRMTVEISSPGDAANFSILGVSDGYPLKRFENEDRIWKGDLIATQDYVIQVAVTEGSAAYSLTVTIVGQ
ncbi:MAG: hypothetical protein HFACDABA_01584 [Anaerolineales bacterium]|nr:hypothetical protein [Anaerolineales bacterium]